MSSDEKNTEATEATPSGITPEATPVQEPADNTSGPQAQDAAPAEEQKAVATQPATVAKKPAPRKGPAETLDRAALLRRYRLARNFAILFGLTTVLLGGIALGQQFGSRGSQDSATQESQQAAASGTDTSQECPIKPRRDADDAMAIGKKNAPVVLVEYLDFRCPYCGVFARETFPTLVEEYVKTGKVRIEVHDVSMIDGDNSTRAAVAARAAGLQGKYFEYAHAVYAAMEHGRPELTDDVLVQYAKTAGVKDIDKFKQDLSSEKLAQAVQQSTDTAEDYGVQSVPTFVDTTNCQVMQGAQGLEKFKQFLDSAVEQAK